MINGFMAIFLKTFFSFYKKIRHKYIYLPIRLRFETLVADYAPLRPKKFDRIPATRSGRKKFYYVKKYKKNKKKFKMPLQPFLKIF
jgi:hypothetical protein